MNTKAFVISLERSADRLAHARTLLPQLPIPGEVLPAVDGSQLSQSELSEFRRDQVHQPGYPFELKLGEIGCFLSHRKAWQVIIDRGLDAGLVLEDDVSIDAGQLHKAVEFVTAHAPQDAYVQFPVRGLPTSAECLVSSPHCQLLRPRVTPLRTSGQWVTRTVAEKLLSATHIFDRPVDTTLQMHWLTGVRMLAVAPSGLSDMTAELGGSTINRGKKGRLTLRNITREVKRKRYRSKIARLSTRATA